MKNNETTEAKEARRQCMNAWRARNKERVQGYNRKYWQKVAEKKQAANCEND